MKKFFTTFVALLGCCVFALFAGCKDDGEQKKPEKIKDGTALTLTVGENKSLNLSEYISVEGTEYGYAAESSDKSVATVELSGNTAKISAVAEGSAVITACADAVEVKFAVTVNKKPEEKPEEKPAPVFGNKTLSYDLKDNPSAELTLAPDSGDPSYRYSYALKTADASVTIDGDKLTAAYDSATEKTLTVIVTYTVGTDASTAKTVEFNVTVTVTDTRSPVIDVPEAPELRSPEVKVEKDLYFESAASLTIDFAENVKNPDDVRLDFAVKNGEQSLELTGSTYNFVYGTYDETATTVVYSVKIAYSIDGTDGELEYTYTLKIKDTSAYRVVNGGFADDLEGWTPDGDIGAVSEQSTFWEQNLPVHNVGKYFAGDESRTGKLTSSLFKVGGVNKITFMLGAAGNKDCYITLENEEGATLAVWRNTKFEDIHEGWDAEQIGKTQFANNLVTYVADLTEFAGETVRIVLNDNATKDFGFINFDELITYYAPGEEIPEGATPAVNELADKIALKAAVDEAITEQGDYTLDSYNAYTAKLTAAQAALDKLSATQDEVDSALSELLAAKTALAVRVPAEKTGVDKTVVILVNKNKQLNLSDYIDDNNLSSLTYAASAADTKVTVSEIADGKFTVTAGAEAAETTVTITVKYKDEVKLTVVLNVSVTSQTAPVLKKEAVSKDIDLYSEDNKTEITLDFAENINNVGELELSYTVTNDGSAVTLTGTSYTLTYGTYTDEATEVVFNVRVAYTANDVLGELEYNYTLNIKDTRAYRVANGGFDSDLEGWTLSNAQLGNVNSDETYWTEKVPFNNDGKFFNAYATDKESAMGTLTSSAFKIGGSGWITYKLGGAKNADKVYLDIIEKDTGAILARYYNNAFSDDTNQTVVRGCTLVAYKANLSEHPGKTVYIRISDYGESEYGLFFVDSFVTYYETEPQGLNNAVGVAHPANIRTGTETSKYQVYNGGFENGLEGWTCVDGAVPGDVSSANR